MNLKDYIEAKGDEPAAELFGVKVRTVRSWRYGDRLPRPAKAQEIVTRTEGQVSMHEIYAGAHQ